jgi:predicted SAM-dependent methyltransferase
MKKLNLGCGNDIRKGFDNFDKYPVEPCVEYVDLECLPLPFPDGSYDYILLNHVFEHITVNQYSFLREMSRILRPGGKLEISVPVNHICMEHEHVFFVWDYFDKVKTQCYGNIFKEVKVTWSRNPFTDIVWKIKQFMFWIINKEIKYVFKKS